MARSKYIKLYCLYYIAKTYPYSISSNNAGKLTYSTGLCMATVRANSNIGFKDEARPPTHPTPAAASHHLPHPPEHYAPNMGVWLR